MNKRVFTIAIIFGFTLMAGAQTRYVGDTIRWGYNADYHYANYPIERSRYELGDLGGLSDSVFFKVNDNGEAIQHDVERPVKVIGLAVVQPIIVWQYYDRDSMGSNCGPRIDSTTCDCVPYIYPGAVMQKQYLHLYEFTGERQARCKARCEWRFLQDSVSRYMRLPFLYSRCFNARTGIWGNLSENYDPNEDSAFYLPVYEYLFDKPVVMYDSFIVGGTHFEHRGTRYVPMYMTVSYRGHIPREEQDRRCVKTYVIEMGVDGNMLTRESPLDPYDPYYGEHYARYTYYSHFELMIYPIIDTTYDPDAPEVADTCSRVTSLRSAVGDHSMVLLSWQGDAAHSRYEVRYTNEVDVDSTITTTATHVTVVLPDTVTEYKAAVRAFCSLDSTWGEWSDSVVFRGHGAPLGITPAAAPCRIYPNPASGEVTVESEEEIAHLAVYDMAGTLRYEATPHHSHCTFSVTGWPAGTYMVQVQTSTGVSNSKLTVY